MQVQKIRYCSRGENITQHMRVKSRPIIAYKKPADERLSKRIESGRKTVLLRKGKQNG